MRKRIMHIVHTLIIGGIIGWLASLVTRTDGQQGMVLNVVVGIIGAAFAALVITPIMGEASPTNGAFGLRSLVVSFLGAIVLLGIITLFRRGSVR
jgi:uncharacterized membrane protein YeaQ/YmgE (transglycosylase-associated protein family)